MPLKCSSILCQRVMKKAKEGEVYLFKFADDDAYFYSKLLIAIMVNLSKNQDVADRTKSSVLSVGSSSLLFSLTKKTDFQDSHLQRDTWLINWRTEKQKINS